MEIGQTGQADRQQADQRRHHRLRELEPKTLSGAVLSGPNHFKLPYADPDFPGPFIHLQRTRANEPTRGLVGVYSTAAYSAPWSVWCVTADPSVV